MTSTKTKEIKTDSTNKKGENSVASSKKKSSKYFEGVGRRKTAVARVRIFEKKTKGGGDNIIINGRELNKYFKLQKNQEIVLNALDKSNLLGSLSVSVKVSGGGVTAQAEAIRHGMARALIKYDSDIRKKLKTFGYLTRDPRMVERKKPGLKKARKAPQWTKR